MEIKYSSEVVQVVVKIDPYKNSRIHLKKMI